MNDLEFLDWVEKRSTDAVAAGVGDNHVRNSTVKRLMRIAGTREPTHQSKTHAAQFFYDHKWKDMAKYAEFARTQAARLVAKRLKE